ALKEVAANRVNDEVHQLSPVIDRLDLHVRWQVLLDLFQFRLEVARDNMAILTHEHETETEHYLTLAVGGDCAAPDFMTDLHVGDVADVCGHALLGCDDDMLDLVQVCGPPKAVDEEHLAALTDAAAAYVSIVLLNRLDCL